MSPKFDKYSRIKIIKKVLAGAEVSQVCKEFGISRQLFYRWLKKYKEEGVRGLSNGKAGRPHLTVVSESHDGYNILSPHARSLMMQEVLEQGATPSEVSKKYGISRQTFYKWLDRYKSTPEAGREDALINQTPKVDRYFRQTPEKYEEAILSMVAKHPEFGIRSIVANLPRVGDLPIVGHHGVQNVLRRHGLSTYAERMLYAGSQRTATVTTIDKILGPVFAFFKINFSLRSKLVKYSGGALFAGFMLVVGLGLIGIFAGNIIFTSAGSKIGLTFAFIALAMSSVFFIYSLKYYITLALVLSYSQKEGIGPQPEIKKGGILSWILGDISPGDKRGGLVKAPGLESDLSHIRLTRKPFISVHIPFYNEKNVVERSIRAATSFKYDGEYEVILCDDSTDETTNLIHQYQLDCLFKNEKLKVTNGNGWTLSEVEIRPGVTLKHLHRTTRDGYKGKALDLALKLANPKAEFVTVFDADFVPYPDSLELFLKYFKAENKMSEDYKKSKIAAVQGYQWHVLNKSENWITRGVRSEYAGSYVIERSGAEIYGGLKQISGSVYMIRRDVLSEIGWGTSITEDFELTLKLYEKGYKVVYTPYIQAPAECVSTIKRLVRQRMRWAEGHSFNVKRMFKKLLFNPALTLAEKVEFLYLSPYYLQAFFFLIGTFSWLLAEAVFRSRLPFWTELWGWSLVLTNMLSLPLVNAVGLFVEESEERDYMGLASFVALSYLLVPFQAYASVKGLVEEKEGPWFRTPKTGRITDIFSRGRFYHFISDILPGIGRSKDMQDVAPIQQGSQYLALTTANNHFNSFAIEPVVKRLGWVSKAALSILLAFTVTLLFFARNATFVYATSWAGPMKLGIGTSPDSTDNSVWPTAGNYLDNNASFSTGVTTWQFRNSTAGNGTSNYTWYSWFLPTGWATNGASASIPSGAYSINIAVVNGSSSNSMNVRAQLLLTSNDGTSNTVILTSGNLQTTTSVTNTMKQFSLGTLGSSQTITASAPNRFAVRLFYINGNKSATGVNWWINNSTLPAQLNIPASITVPEIVKVPVFVIVMIIVPVAPAIVSGRFRRKDGNIIQEMRDAWKDILDKLFGAENEKALDKLPV